jgi:hypothetical protein
MQLLQHLRDFLNEDTMKWMPGNLNAGNFILLTEHKKIPITEEQKAKGVNVASHTTVIHVFDHGGVFIGTIENPDWIPKA